MGANEGGERHVVVVEVDPVDGVQLGVTQEAVQVLFQGVETAAEGGQLEGRGGIQQVYPLRRDRMPVADHGDVLDDSVATAEKVEHRIVVQRQLQPPQSPSSSRSSS